MTTAIAAFPTSSTVPPASSTSASGSAPEFPFSLHDLISIVNPLQHIPIVSTIYRAITGDTIGPAERIAGDTLYGGLWGFVSSVANVAFQEITGKDFGDTTLAFLEDETGLTLGSTSSATPAAAQVASTASSPQANATPAAASSTPTATPSTAAAATTASAIAPVPAAAAAPSSPSTNAAAAAVPSAIVPKKAVTAPAAPSTDLVAANVPAVIANGPPKQLAPAVSTAQSQASDQAMLALLASMNEKGIDATLSQRAMTAYSKSLALSPGETIPMF